MSGSKDNSKALVPNELFLGLIDVLEKADERGTLAKLRRCNKNFYVVATEPMYRRFFLGPGEGNANEGSASAASILSNFLKTMARRPDLQEHVRELWIEHRNDLIDDVSVANACRTLVPIVTSSLGIELEIGLDNWTRPTTLVIEILLCLLYQLTSVHLNLEASESFYYVQCWKEDHPDNRLNDLKEVVLEYRNAGGEFFFLPAQGLLGGAAPNIERLVLRRRCSVSVILDEREELMYDSTLPDSTSPYIHSIRELMPTLENLRELVLDNDCLGEWKDYFVARNCRRLKSLTYIGGANTFYGDSWDGLLDDLDDIVDEGIIDFSLKSIETLETLTISQSAIIVGRVQVSVARDGDEMLDNFFPLSLKTLRIVDFDYDLYESIQRFAHSLKSKGYKYLELVELVPGARDPTKVLTEDEENLIMALFTDLNVKCTFIRG